MTQPVVLMPMTESMADVLGFGDAQPQAPQGPEGVEGKGTALVQESPEFKPKRPFMQISHLRATVKPALVIWLVSVGFTMLSGCGHLERVPIDRPVVLEVPTTLTNPTALPVLPWDGLQGETRSIDVKDVAVAWDRAEVAITECNADKADIRAVIEAQKAFIQSPAQGWNSLMRAMTTAGRAKRGAK